MGKRTGENQDYYKRAGGDPGRRMLARERKKIADARAGEAKSGGSTLPHSEPPVKSVGAGAETAQWARRKREEREAAKAEHEEVQRMVESQRPTPPPERLLPRARRSTALGDWWRSVEESAAGLAKAGRDAYRSFGELARAPARFVRILRTSNA